MPTRTYPRPRPASLGQEIRLPWWAVALPVLAFAVLLVVMAGPGQAQAVTPDPGVDRIIDRIHQTFTRQT